MGLGLGWVIAYSALFALLLVEWLLWLSDTIVNIHLDTPLLQKTKVKRMKRRSNAKAWEKERERTTALLHKDMGLIHSPPRSTEK
jgi:hypothetical protein